MPASKLGFLAFTASVISCVALLADAQPAQPHGLAPHIQWVKYSDDVFATAKKENRFVLLDLEAVWCHWCHVQDEVTFADPAVIALVNSRYIAVKVDQDSRPDLSNRYEDYGWPATIVLNADGGEIVKRQGYIPPKPMAGLLQAIIDDPSPGPSVQPERQIQFGQSTTLSPALKKELTATLDGGYDSAQGGWGQTHKFLDWDTLEFEMTLARHGDHDAEARVRQTLDVGIHLVDPVWGGVDQYSTDDDWVHPHFEKLMQFQAETLRIYAMAGAQFHDAKYEATADLIHKYIATFLTAPDGAFYVSQDADLTPGEHSADYFALDDAGRRKMGVPHVDTHEYARETGWGIQGLLAYYNVRQSPADLAAAVRAAEWAVANRSLSGGGFRHDAVDPTGPYLGDTLAMGRAFLSLYHSTGDVKWIVPAEQAADFIAAHFAVGDDAPGFVTAITDGPLRSRPQLDENVAAARFLNLLWQVSGEKRFHTSAGRAMRYLANDAVARSRSLFVAGILLADDEAARDPLHVTIVGSHADPLARDLFSVGLRYPDGYYRLDWWDRSTGALARTDVEYPVLSVPAAFVCSAASCSSPIKTVQGLYRKLANLK